jgi:dipeptidyl aminopeptidase/acylaminoacyl peptidase
MERRPIYFNSEEERLAGDLISPDGDGPFPAMVVLMGYGSQNRYGHSYQAGKWSTGGAFRSFTGRLAEEGFAVLCWDKRGVGESTGGDRAPGDPPGDRESHANILTDVADAESALNYLARQPEIDPQRVAVWGASAGVYFASVLAARTDLPAVYVLVAGTYQGLPELCEYLFDWINHYLACFPEEEAWFKEHARYHLNFARHWRGYIEAAERGDDVYEQGEGENKARYYLARPKYELAHPPAEQFRYIRKPTLVMHGDRDVNVPVEDSYEIVRALREAGNKDVTHIVVPRADHGMRIAPVDDDVETRRLARVRGKRGDHPQSEFYFQSLIGWLTDRLLIVPPDAGAKS